MRKKLLAMALCLCMVMTLLPTMALAVSGERSIQLGSSAFQGSQNEAVYFGSYAQSAYTPTIVPKDPQQDTLYIDDNGTEFYCVFIYTKTGEKDENGWNIYRKDPSYYKFEPVVWRVLSNSDGKLFLVANESLDMRPYNTAPNDVDEDGNEDSNGSACTWETSTIRPWLNDTFYNAAFSEKERAAIETTLVQTADNPVWGTDGGNDTEDKVFLLSAEDVGNTDYGFSENILVGEGYNALRNKMANRADYTAFTTAHQRKGTLPGDWFLRSPGESQSRAVHVDMIGRVGVIIGENMIGATERKFYVGVGVNSQTIGTRPAMNLDADQILFFSLAENLKPAKGDEYNAVGGKFAKGMDSGLTAVPNAKNIVSGLSNIHMDSSGISTTLWKLTMLDESRSAFTSDTVSESNGVLTVAYENATVGENEYISAMLKDSDGNVTQYGRLLQLDGTTNGANGTVDIDLSGVDMSNQTLYVFNEQYNGTQMVDYSSPLTEPNAFTITFDANGGSSAPAPVRTTEGKLPELPIGSQPGCQFVGWYTEAEGGKQITENSIFTEDTTIYAHWIYVGNNTTTTVTNPDGSTTTTVTDTATGTATITDKATNGVTTVTKTDKDGAATETTVTVPDTVKDPVKVDVPTDLGKADGTVSAVVTYPDGKKETVTGAYSGGKVSVTVNGTATIEILDDFAPLASALPFEDVPTNAWYYKELVYAYENGLFAGTSDTSFSPKAPMTRQQMWMVLARMAGENPADMDAARKWAMENKVSDGTNSANDVTREQFVTLLWRFAGSPKATKDMSGYSDFDSVSDYAKEAMRWAVENGIVSGTTPTTLNPTGNAIREQVAAILARYAQK